MEKEIRTINTSAKVELRKDGTPGSIHGMAIVYNRDSEDMGFIEQIAPGAVTKALKKSDIRALKNHDPSLIYGRSGVNLTFKDTPNGLEYEATPLNTRNFQETAEEIRTGLLTGQSFGFTVLADEWSDLDTDKPRRKITEIGQIFDVSAVTYPAYPDTTVALRSMEMAKEKPVTEKTHDNIDNVIDKINSDIESLSENLKSLRSGINPGVNTDSAEGHSLGADDLADGEDKEIMAKITKLTKKYEVK